jgi:hypothetical protein
LEVLVVLPQLFSVREAPDNPAFLISGRIPDFIAGYPVRPDTGYPAIVKLILLIFLLFFK